MIDMASHRPLPQIFQVIAEAWRELRKGLPETYRPELHYMRGPGPKWREKHGAPHTTRFGAVNGKRYEEPPHEYAVSAGRTKRDGPSGWSA